jgi:hypothetical protein
VVTHGAFAHFLTEDWDVEDPMIGTAYKNCKSPNNVHRFILISTGEHREFVFTSTSTSEDAHVLETKESRSSRGANQAEDDPHVVEEMMNVDADNNV